ncbi:hypothetical protein PUN28_015758 [Cardiocondyla obscurior]|uniref:MADF domain-containing protein n=1 Tax=Cardiocondyla obscurior TaxID=286306 RepID=A0AAW2EWU9_9HYME
MQSEYHLDSNTENFDTFVIEEILISEVQERSCLWDHTMDIKIRGMDTVRKAWEEIRQVLSIFRSKSLSKKWKNLRDTFLRKYKQEKSCTASGSAAANKIKNNWKFYEQIKFLKSTVQHRRIFSNLQGITNLNEEFDSCENTNTMNTNEDTNTKPTFKETRISVIKMK